MELLPIRRAESADIPEILRLLTQVNMVHHNGRPDLFKGPATKYTPAQLETILHDDTTPVFVCPAPSGQIAGYAFCILTRKPHDNILTDILTLYIDDLCVDESRRGQGIGKALYAHVHDYAARKGCYNLTLNVWTLNSAAMRFYETCGLVPQKTGMETIVNPDLSPAKKEGESPA